MKRKSLLTVLSALLCASTLLVGCGDDAGTSSGANKPSSMTEASGFTGTKISDFIEEKYEAEAVKLSTDTPTLLNEEYGNVIDRDDDILVFKKTDRDFLNNVTETYRVYNADKGKVIVELTNTYEDGDYTGKDEFGNPKKKPSEMDVELQVKSLAIDESGYQIPYIEVVTTKYTEIDEEIIEKEELETSYTVSKVTEYYDIAGTKIASTPLSLGVKVLASNVSYSEGELSQAKLLFGDTVAVFDLITEEVLSTYGANESKPDMFDYETEQYGYYFNNTLTSMRGGGSATGNAVEVYDKASGELVYSYVANFMEMTMANALQSGAVVLQTVDFVEFMEMMEGTSKTVDVTTKLIDVAAGTTTEVECDYFIDMVATADAYERLGSEIEGITITENFKNFAIAYDLNKAAEGAGMEDDAMQILFLDNALNVEFAVEPVLPLAEDTNTLKKLATGDYLVELKDGALDGASAAIIKEDGTLRTYVPVGAEVVGEWIVTNTAIYDLDGNLIEKYQFNARYNGDEWSYKGHMGETLVFEREYETTYNGEPVEHTEVCFVEERVNYGYDEDEEDDAKFEYTYYSECTVEEVGDSYVVLYSQSSEEYRLFNVDGNVILETNNPMDVYEADGVYTIVTYVGYTDTAANGTAVYQIEVKTDDNQKGGAK